MDEEIIKRWDDLVNHEELILLKMGEWETMISTDAQTVLYNCKLCYASRILGNLWKKGYLKRRRVRTPHGGKKYKYWLSPKGEKIVIWLQEKSEESM